MRGNRLWLVSYDIADPRRLRRVARFMEAHGVRVQYSVFVAELSDRQLKNMLVGLQRLIHPKEDDVRCYPLPPGGEVGVLGQQLFPEDIMVIRNGWNILRLEEGVAVERERKRRARGGEAGAGAGAGESLNKRGKKG